MKEFIEKWKTKFESVNVECHIVDGNNNALDYDMSKDYSEDIDYVFLQFTNPKINLSEIEELVGHNFPNDLKDAMEKIGFFKIEDDYGNLLAGFKNITFFNESTKTNENSTEEEIYLIKHAFSVAKSWNYDDSEIFIAFNKLGQPILGSYNHDDYLYNLQPYTLNGLLKLLDVDLEDVYQSFVEDME